MFKQFIFFASIGIIGTLGHYLTLVSLVELLALAPVYATTLGFIVGALINYTLNYHYTFRSNKRHRDALSKFMLIALIGALFNYAIMYIGTGYSHFHYIIIQLFATAVVLLWNFLMSKLWAFSQN